MPSRDAAAGDAGPSRDAAAGDAAQCGSGGGRRGSRGVAGRGRVGDLGAREADLEALAAHVCIEGQLAGSRPRWRALMGVQSRMQHDDSRHSAIGRDPQLEIDAVGGHHASREQRQQLFVEDGLDQRGWTLAAACRGTRRGRRRCIRHVPRWTGRGGRRDRHHLGGVALFLAARGAERDGGDEPSAGRHLHEAAGLLPPGGPQRDLRISSRSSLTSRPSRSLSAITRPRSSAVKASRSAGPVSRAMPAMSASRWSQVLTFTSTICCFTLRRSASFGSKNLASSCCS